MIATMVGEHDAVVELTLTERDGRWLWRIEAEGRDLDQVPPTATPEDAIRDLRHVYSAETWDLDIARAGGCYAKDTS